MKSAIKLLQQGAKFIRFTSGDEQNHFVGSYWELDGKIVKCPEKYNKDVINSLIQTLYNKEEVSDGYHTFKELYLHRILLFIALCNLQPDQCHKTHKNFEKQEWPGWFILVLHHPIAGQISYHIPDKYWDNVRCKSVEWNFTYDGHNSSDVLDRLLKM